MRRVLSSSPPLSADRVRPACPQPRLQASLPDCVPDRTVGVTALAAAAAAAAAAAVTPPRRRAVSSAGDSGQVNGREQYQSIYGTLPRLKTTRTRPCTPRRFVRQPRGGMYLADYVLGKPAPKYFNPPPTHGVKSPELQEAIANLRRISQCAQTPVRSTNVRPLQQPCQETDESFSTRELSPESQLKKVLRGLRPISPETRRPVAMCGSHQIGHKYYTWIASKCPDSP